MIVKNFYHANTSMDFITFQIKNIHRDLYNFVQDLSFASFIAFEKRKTFDELFGSAAFIHCILHTSADVTVNKIQKLYGA